MPRFASLRCRSLLVIALFLSAAGNSFGSDAGAPRVADLGWLAGTWQGTLENGAQFEAHYTTADGGRILSMSKEVRDGRAVFFEFELFHEREGVVIYQPFPNGRPSAHDFPLTGFEADGESRKAVFENKAHDFPQAITFAQPTPDSLVITLSGPGKDDTWREMRFALRRRPAG